MAFTGQYTYSIQLNKFRISLGHLTPVRFRSLIIIDPVIKRNEFFDRGEHILLLTDESKHIKDLALKTSGYAEIRVLKLSTLHFYAEDYVDFIDWGSL